MSRVRCPQNRCSFWLNGWCDADEIELEPETLSCMTFDEIETEDDLPDGGVSTDDEDLEFEWLDEESIFEDELDESLYGVDDGDPDLEDESDERHEEEEDTWRL